MKKFLLAVLLAVFVMTTFTGVSMATSTTTNAVECDSEAGWVTVFSSPFAEDMTECPVGSECVAWATLTTVIIQSGLNNWYVCSICTEYPSLWCIL